MFPSNTSEDGNRYGGGDCVLHVLRGIHRFPGFLFVALGNDRKYSRYVLKVHRIAHLDVAPPVIDETEAVTSRSKVVCSRFIELPNRGIGNLYVDSGSTH